MKLETTPDSFLVSVCGASPLSDAAEAEAVVTVTCIEKIQSQKIVKSLSLSPSLSLPLSIDLGKYRAAVCNYGDILSTPNLLSDNATLQRTTSIQMPHDLPSLL